MKQSNLDASGWVNFAEIRTKVSLADVLFQLYHINNLKQQDSKLVGPCPVHGGDSPRAFHADLDRNIWHCFSRCKAGGNQLDFVAKREGITIREAALKLKSFFLINDNGPRGSPEMDNRQEHGGETAREKPVASAGKEGEQENNVPDGNPPLNLQLNLRHDHPHLLQDRQLSVSTCEHFDVGYCSQGIMKGCIAIPIHDENGKLVAYAGRRLKPQHIRDYGKYKLPKGFRKELVLYNFHRAKEHMEEKGLILVEGFFTVLKLFEAGFANVVACMGCEVSKRQAEFMSQAKEVVVLFDGDEAGEEGGEAVRQRLAAMPVRLIRLPKDTDPDALSPKALRWVINGMQALDLKEVAFWVAIPD